MRPQSGSTDHQIARVASRQHGNVTREQLLALELDRDDIKRRLRKGLLHREFRGVYRVGHRAPSLDARYSAAVLACGRDAALSGFAAAFRFAVIKGAAPPEVTTTKNRHIPGITTHRVRHLDSRDVTKYRGIPTLTVPCVLVGLAGTLSLDALARACHEAEVKHRVGARHVEAVLARSRRVVGIAKLRAVYEGDAHVLLSWLEREFLRLLERARLPVPQTNKHLGGRYVDCRWPALNLTVELDSFTYHHTRHAWEQDRAREREARARGDAFRRYTYADVAEEPESMLAELSTLTGTPPASVWKTTQ